MATSKHVRYSKLGNFRFKNIGKETLLTNDVGFWIFLNEKDFSYFLDGKISSKHKLFQELNDKGFLKGDKKQYAKLASQYLKINQSLAQGPSLFILVTTLRCNHRCLYCQVTPEHYKKKGFNMDQATAKKTVDLIFRTPSNSVGIEFQGGEPLLNWPVLEYVVKYAKIVNLDKKKNLKISLVSNMTLMDDKKIKFLLKEGVSVSCSFDGIPNVHDKNRIYLGGKGGSHRLVTKQIKNIQKAITEKNKKNNSVVADKLNAILTVTKFSLPFAKEIIDEYRRNNFDNVFIRPLSPFGLERQTLGAIGYKAEDFIKFYRKSMDYILKLNENGHFFVERGTFYALKKIVQGQDSNYLEMRSPCGAGIGQMAFDYDGKIYTCDEGRMAARMGHQNFNIGHVDGNNYNQIIDNEVNKTMCLASSLDNHVSCANCVYKPYCGTCPLANFIEHGTIFPQLTNTDRCKINKAIFDYIFSKLKNAKYKAIFEKWLEQGA